MPAIHTAASKDILSLLMTEKGQCLIPVLSLQVVAGASCGVHPYEGAESDNENPATGEEDQTVDRPEEHNDMTDGADQDEEDNNQQEDNQGANIDLRATLQFY